MSAAANEVAELDATAQAELVRTTEVSALELVEWVIERIEALNPTLNVVVTPCFDRALDAARSTPRGPFGCVPYLLKDLALEYEGVRFTEGSVFLRDNLSGYTSELVLRLQRAGLVVLGKTNTPEFGMAPACEPTLFGPTRNPWDTARSTSGSSGGLGSRGHGDDGARRRPGRLDPLPGLGVRRVRSQRRHAFRPRQRRARARRARPAHPLLLGSRRAGRRR